MAIPLKIDVKIGQAWQNRVFYPRTSYENLYQSDANMVCHGSNRYFKWRIQGIDSKPDVR